MEKAKVSPAYVFCIFIIGQIFLDLVDSHPRKHAYSELLMVCYMVLEIHLNLLRLAIGACSAHIIRGIIHRLVK